MNIWKRVSVFQIITALFVVVCIYVAWRWRTHVPPTIPEFIVPGLFVAVLGAVAVIITLRPQPMSKGEKIFWIVAATILCVCEISVLESAARGHLDQFNKIM